MNQILSTEVPKSNKKVRGVRTPADIEKILKFFAIGMIIFGIFMIGSGSYAMYQNSKLTGNSSKPTIYIEETSATAITIQVSHNKELSKVSYYWNNQEPIELECSGKKKVEQKVDLLTGKNTITIIAVDVNGLESKTQKQYEVQGDISIEFQAEGNNIKIKAEISTRAKTTPLLRFLKINIHSNKYTRVRTPVVIIQKAIISSFGSGKPCSSTPTLNAIKNKLQNQPARSMYTIARFGISFLLYLCVLRYIICGVISAAAITSP